VVYEFVLNHQNKVAQSVQLTTQEFWLLWTQASLQPTGKECQS